MRNNFPPWNEKALIKIPTLGAGEIVQGLRLIALHAANPGLIPGITHSPPSTASTHPWAQIQESAWSSTGFGWNVPSLAPPPTPWGKKQQQQYNEKKVRFSTRFSCFTLTFCSWVNFFRSHFILFFWKKKTAEGISHFFIKFLIICNSHRLT